LEGSQSPEATPEAPHDAVDDELEPRQRTNEPSPRALVATDGARSWSVLDR
jgi:hypothetical protein